jgi:sugar-specific transcriptional regulator TrmB
MYEDTLIKSGLSPEQAKIYSFLLSSGPKKARKIGLETGIKRGLVYKALDQLIELALVEKIEKDGEITLFSPLHPNHIVDLIAERKKTLESATEAIKGVVGQMTSDFNLISKKPNVQFYEGMSGAKTVLEDSLYAKSEILTYADLETVEKYIHDLNAWYAGERDKYGLKKKVLVLDTPFNRKTMSGYHEEVTDVRFLPIESEPFATIVEIYDNKISYVSLGETIIGVIITDNRIADLHKKLFEFNWRKASPIENKKVEKDEDNS